MFFFDIATKLKIFLVVLQLFLPISALALPSFIDESKRVGGFRMQYMWLDLYDISLYSPEGSFNRDKVFALEIFYLRDFKGTKIAERTIYEIKKRGFNNSEKLNLWFTEIKSVFPDVKKGDSLVGVKDNQGGAKFYMNGVEIGGVSSAEFSQEFFDIWLGSNSRYPEYSKRLKGS